VRERQREGGREEGREGESTLRRRRRAMEVVVVVVVVEEEEEEEWFSIYVRYKKGIICIYCSFKQKVSSIVG
jgi:hypothetical protein